ncbi:MAG: BON domain-containing protein [Acidobacteriota bacterium]|nr:BON domain-containing protein [Acidobacteriota bacterium]
MSYVRLSLGTLALGLLTVAAAGSIATAEAAQKGAIKDGWLVTKLHSLFVNEDALSGSNIDVDVKAGLVTLQGTVPNEAARGRAIAIVKGADGVKGVTDQLRVAPEHRGIDDKAADKAKAAGRKTANAAEKAADKTVAGAKKTGRAIDDGWIKSKIYAQYMADWNDILDDSNIDVDVDNNMVTLNGTVKSAAAKARAVSIAKSTDGVKGVKDLLKVGTTTR